MYTAGGNDPVIVFPIFLVCVHGILQPFPKQEKSHKRNARFVYKTPFRCRIELTQIVRTAQKRPLMKGYEIQAANWHRNSNGVSFVFVWMRWWL